MMRWSSTTSRGSADRVYRAASPVLDPARNGFAPLRAVIAALAVALFATAALRAAPVEELFGVWVLDHAGVAADANQTPGVTGDLAIWHTDAGIGLTWNRLPPDPGRRTFEFARGATGTRLEVVRSDPAMAAGERVEAWLESDRLVVSIVRDSSDAVRDSRYNIFVHNGRLVFDYRLRRGAATIEVATRQLRRLKVMM